jgi:hypothetical protein
MKIETIPVRDLNNGIIQKIDNLLAPQNSVEFSINLLYSEVLGRGVVRSGTDLIGTQIADGKDILGLHQFILSDGTKHFLAVVDGSSNSALYRFSGGSWTTESVSGVKATKHRFLTYLDTCLLLDGTNATSSADGDSWVTSGGNLDVGNCPKGKYAVEWHDKVHIAGVSGNLDTVYYSSIPTAGAISWTSGNGSMQIEPYEGQGAITGLGKVPGYLLIFKERALKRWNGSSTFPDDLCNLGTPSQESVVNGKTTSFFFSSSYKKAIGFYETNGETTRKISRAIQEVVEAISSSNYANIAGFSDGEVAFWSIGDIDYDGITYSNVVAFYHIESQSWALLSFPTEFKIFAPYIDGTTLKITGGNDDGEIIELFTGQKDNYTNNSNIPIEYAVQYHPFELGSRGRLKEVSKIVPYVEEGLSCKLSMRVDNESGFREKGIINDPFENEINAEEQGHLFEFRFFGQGLGNLTQIIGFDILTPDMSETIKT